TQEQQALAKSASKQAEDLAERLRKNEEQLRQLRAEEETARGDRDKLTSANKKLQTLENEIADRQREMAEAGRRADNLESERKTLLAQARRRQAAADSRFAGISLTGHRVVFLVDMSGSMELLDERTPSAGKWQGVRETLARIMKSLPELEKYQVILFSDRVSYPLGNENGWLTYDTLSADRALNALAAVRPVGDTNLYAAFEAAFRLRASGLDTIYLLSDGLPSIGGGMSAEQARQLKETERTDILSKQLRKALLTDWNRPQPDRPKVRINAVGFFYESPDVGAFLWAMAREHDGSFVGMSKP